MQGLIGNKTYIVALLTACYAITATLLGKLDLQTAIQMVSTALLAAGLRHGISTETEPPKK
jgi:VIT1/CCC1 family predicted Fe2+/Mn2+ transporter